MNEFISKGDNWQFVNNILIISVAVRKAKKQARTNPKVAVERLNKKNGFDKGFTAERIIGITRTSGRLMMLVKWKDIESAEMIPANVANEKCPQVVIKFYEQVLQFY